MAQGRVISTRWGLFLAGLLGCTVVVAASTANKSQAQAQGSEQAKQRELVQAQRAALRIGGLRAAAKINGSVELRGRGSSTVGMPRNLSELASVSDLIVVGTQIGNRSVITSDQLSIATWNNVVIDEVIKGSPELSRQRIIVAVEGGKVSFEDGSWAQILPSDVELPLAGHVYVWFLRATEREDYDMSGSSRDLGFFVLSHGGLGLYDVSRSTETVVPSGQYRSVLSFDVARSGLGPTAFVEEVRAAVKQ